MGDCIIHEVLISFWGFTRFWSLPSPAEGHLRGQYHSGSLFTRFWSRSLCYFRHDRSDFCLSVNSVKHYCFSLLFVNFNLSLMGSSPVFPAPFPAKSNVFRRNRPIWFPISCCFFMKVDHIWCPPPASPSVTPFTKFWSRFGDSARRREIQTSWISSLRPASREIKTSCIGAGRKLTEWDQDLANSSPSECRRRDQNLVYTLYI